MNQFNSLITIKNTNLSFNTTELEDYYLKTNFLKIEMVFYKIFNHFKNNNYSFINSELQNFIDKFTETFIYFFSKVDFILNKSMVERFILLSPVITNVFAISKFKITDLIINKIENHENNFYKLLILYNCRNEIKINRKNLFDINPELASLWYGTYFITSLSYQTKTIQDNMNQHLEFWDERMVLNSEQISYGYMLSTYINHKTDRLYKSRFNKLVKKNFKSPVTDNIPDKRKIAIVSGLWKHEHVLYRNTLSMLKSLKNDYELTLICLREENYQLNILQNDGLFEEIKYISMKDIRENTNNLKDITNKFIMLFYIDTGMEPVSRFLSNLRIAPIQMMRYGHPVSTFDSETDYFFGGIDSENVDEVEKNYSERFILTPGLGLSLDLPTFQKRIITKTTDTFIINCSWSSFKVNYSLLLTLKQIQSQVTKKILFRFFPNIRNENNNFIVFKNDMESILGKENCEICQSLNIDEYMNKLQEGDIAIDSHVFAGMNSIVDNLYLKKPIITRQGWQHYNKAGSSILHKAGLSELVACDEKEYIDKVVQIINDNQYRESLVNKIDKLDLSAIFNSMTDIPSFKKAMDYIIENNDKLKEENSNKPIFIK